MDIRDALANAGMMITLWICCRPAGSSRQPSREGAVAVSRTCRVQGGHRENFGCRQTVWLSFRLAVLQRLGHCPDHPGPPGHHPHHDPALYPGRHLWPALGTTTFACNLLFLLLQRILLRRRLGIAELLQIPAVLIFSVFIDFWMHLTGALVTDVYVWQIVMCIVGSAVLGAGISLEIMSNATVIPGEGLVIVIAARSRKNFGNIKVLFDCSLVLASCLLGLAVLGSIGGLREGTVLSAVLVGMFARLTSPWTRKLKPLLWSPEQRRLLRQIKAEMPPRQK